jgi:uncharacterized protein
MLGLLGRRCMAPDEALLLPRCRSIHTLGMRFPIRMAFLDRDLAVLGVRDIAPGYPFVRLGCARHVLELPAGADVRNEDRFSLVLLGDEKPAASAADILSRLLPR